MVSGQTLEPGSDGGVEVQLNTKELPVPCLK